jgi:SAM-dependent methyltransferase
MMSDNWAEGDAYDAYMGRWSRALAPAFLDWLAPRTGASWLEVGCGTGALTAAICGLAEPSSVVACDPSAAFVEHARDAVRSERASFVTASAGALPERTGGFDYVVSALVLNFLPDPARGVSAMSDRLRPDGIVAAYVWDYGNGFEFLRRFWDEAVGLDGAAAALDEGRRFPLCRPEALEQLFVHAGLRGVAAGILEIPTRFENFEDFWLPFLRGTGPAPAYVASLPPEHRERLRNRLAARAAREGLKLKAQAHAIRGSVSP